MKTLRIASLLAGLAACAAQADIGPNMTVTVTEAGGAVVLSFAGIIDTAGMLTDTTESLGDAGYWDSDGSYASFAGMSAGTIASYMSPISSLNGSYAAPDTMQLTGSRTGDAFGLGLSFAAGIIFLSPDYVSGTALSGSVTLPGTTAATLGFVSDFDYTLGNNSIAFDTQLTAVPVPATLPLLAGGMGALVLAARRRR